ncbi:MAG: hypothetical protein QOJ47_1711, partial [Gaiellales bacterium]|nr:hypothetical protein [Gaiellales bacterium]
RYRLALTARAGAATVTKAADAIVDRTVTGLQESLAAISPNGDGVNDTVSLSFTLTADVGVRVDVEQILPGLPPAIMATLFQGLPGIGAHTIDWDGTSNGLRLPDGRYAVIVTATDLLGDVQQSLPLSIDTVAPVLTLVDARTLAFTLSEPATVTVLVNQRTRIVASEPAGSFRVPFTGTVAQLSAQAQDAAGNSSPLLLSP